MAATSRVRLIGWSRKGRNLEITIASIRKARKKRGEARQPTSLLEDLEAAQVLFVHPATRRRFELIEGCDRYFSVVLTRKQLIKLADELRALAETT